MTGDRVTPPLAHSPPGSPVSILSSANVKFSDNIQAIFEAWTKCRYVIASGRDKSKSPLFHSFLKNWVRGYWVVLSVLRSRLLLLILSMCEKQRLNRNAFHHQMSVNKVVLNFVFVLKLEAAFVASAKCHKSVQLLLMFPVPISYVLTSPLECVRNQSKLPS